MEYECKCEVQCSCMNKYDYFGYGCSTIIHKNGEVLASAQTIFGEEIIYAQLPVSIE